MEIEKRLSSVQEFCNRNGISRSTFYSQVRQGRLRTLKVGRSTRILREDEERWLVVLRGEVHE